MRRLGAARLAACMALAFTPGVEAPPSDAGGAVLAELSARLDSPFLAERGAALKELSRRGRPDRATFSAWLEGADLRARRSAAALLADDAMDGTGAALSGALLVEPDARVAELLLRALALQPGELAALSAKADSSGDELLVERVARLRRAVVLDALSARMRDGRVPGFYDGQWAAIWPLDPRLPEELLAIAFDDGLHLVLRELAVMALHETRRPTLEQELAGLIHAEESELADLLEQWVEQDPTQADLERHRRFELSRYVRFALAKAGMTRPILRMIGEMEAYLAEPRQKHAIDFRGDRESGWPRYAIAEYLRALLFEVGYYYQQFDDYASAERCYRELLGRFAESRACQNAHYNLACISAIQGQREQALDHLRKAIQRGFDDSRWLLEDGDFTSLRADPEFRRLVDLSAQGVADDSGIGWNRMLRKFLPAGCESFFDLSQAKQAEVWQNARSDLSQAERRRMVEEAPSDQRDFVARLVDLR
ncbi:MAG: hypothetical protein EXS13_05695 [Planctomycetes bacterium]|nr:hypothetical protein [Planctomycetota bacterium]